MRFVALLLTVILRVAHLALCVLASFDLGLLLPSAGGSGGGGGGTESLIVAAMSRAIARSAVNGQPGRELQDSASKRVTEPTMECSLRGNRY